MIKHAITLFLVVFTFFATSNAIAQSTGTIKVIKNPYAGIDWERVNQYMANFHAHTVNSDGRVEPDHLINMYADAGYSILAISDHDLYYITRPGESDPGPTTETTWPWTRWIDEQPSQIWDYSGMETSAFYPDLGDGGMLAIRANELTQHPHIISLFNDCGFAESNQTDNSRLDCIESKNGLGYYAHPPLYMPPEKWSNVLGNSFEKAAAHFADHIIRYPGNLGIELPSFVQDEAVKLFDKILMAHYRDHDIFAHGGDDTHETYVKQNADYTIVLAEELTEEAVRHALQNGQTIVGSRTQYPPIINRIEVDSASSRIIVDILDPRLELIRPTEGSIAGNPPEFEWGSKIQITWFKNGQEYATGNSIDYSGFTEETVLRFEFVSGDETFYSQAFYIAPEEGI
ncbi:MAG: hypothetical protein LC662_11410 [Rhodothermaceae bacterium]|nr:hypothetical protein [Rhodothermaceae bacterium]